mmetsp:Transcript_25398/g.36367  ORF Transcript_25398/g.36367 Transcript_25398/m.36367 type:complete len:129 (-) Transcript_25398:529-915(-)
MISIALPLPKLFVVNASHASRVRPTIAEYAAYSLVIIIVSSAISGCRQKKVPTTAAIADFAASVEEKISSTALIAECASMPIYSRITTARLESTCRIVPSAKKTYSRVEVPATKCPVDTPYTGTVSAT